MEVTSREAKTILTAQKTGFLASGPYPFTHSLSAYTGCGFGQTTCGLYCYAQFMPNWRFHHEAGTEWGMAVQIKSNAAELLDQELKRLGPTKRQKLRIFMSSSTDPYQPIESKYEVTRRLLEVFARYDDLELLVIQTRSPLASRDFDLVKKIPYAWLSVTIETDDQALLHDLKGGPPLTKRFALLKEAKEAGLKAQITVSPCMPYTPEFAQRLQDTGVDHIIMITLWTAMVAVATGLPKVATPSCGQIGTK